MRRIGFAFLALLFATAMALAQPNKFWDRMNVKFSQPVVVSNSLTLQPGTYTFQQVRNPDAPDVFKVMDQNGKSLGLTANAHNAVWKSASTHELPTQTHVVLQKVGGKAYLEKMWFAGQNHGYGFALADDAKSNQESTTEQASNQKPQEIIVLAIVPTSESAQAGSSSVTTSDSTGQSRAVSSQPDMNSTTGATSPQSKSQSNSTTDSNTASSASQSDRMNTSNSTQTSDMNTNSSQSSSTNDAISSQPQTSSTTGESTNSNSMNSGNSNSQMQEVNGPNRGWTPQSSSSSSADQSSADQSSADQSGQNSGAGQSGQTQIVGCVTGPFGGSYMLTSNADGKQYKLRGDYDNIRESVGKTITVWGTPSNDNSNSSQTSANNNSSANNSGSSSSMASNSNSGQSSTSQANSGDTTKLVPLAIIVERVQPVSEQCDQSKK